MFHVRAAAALGPRARLPSIGSTAAGMAGVFLLGALQIPSDAMALSAEEVFRGAASYTVKVRTLITTAFVEESKGTRFGAGFVVDAERGWIMTNAHVAGRSQAKISVAFKGKPYVEARKVYVDPFLDLAILRV